MGLYSTLISFFLKLRIDLFFFAVAHMEPKEYYQRALNLVKDLLDGCEDSPTYEDRLRDMFGIYAYPWFTMDRLVTNLVRLLHLLASHDDLSPRLTALFRAYFRSSGGSAPQSAGRHHHRHDAYFSMSDFISGEM